MALQKTVLCQDSVKLMVVLYPRCNIPLWRMNPVPPATALTIITSSMAAIG
jgi:hypothetical protein